MLLNKTILLRFENIETGVLDFILIVTTQLIKKLKFIEKTYLKKCISCGFYNNKSKKPCINKIKLFYLTWQLKRDPR